ncbi:MAG: flagellar motor protein MotB [Methylocystis sp.]|uniref:flagellar motor protein MotB n=1 Tax=Methylocystis sp. TaxID=1911079 RepID=UPI003DA45A35
MSHDGPPIIIKKKVEGEEEHHGGVWKLAFADFMTAMMAFFLVMWLINSTSKETKAVIVQYFNPVQLVDVTSAHKGLRDPNSGAEGKSAVASTPSDKKEGAGAKDLEGELQKNPLKALDAIAEGEPRASEPQTLRDPFDRSARTDRRAPIEAPPAESTQSPPGEKSAPRHGQGVNAAEKGKAEQAKIATELQAEVEKVAAQEQHAPKIEVKQSEDGLLISLTDDSNFSMFDVGSIKPRPQLVRILADIGKILSGKRGEVELRGHTDARAYAGKNYDNWRLSSDRATLVNYMLIRGGLPAARIGKIVGFADRQPKVPSDPLSPLNRRIEILLKGPAR